MTFYILYHLMMQALILKYTFNVNQSASNKNKPNVAPYVTPCVTSAIYINLQTLLRMHSKVIFLKPNLKTFCRVLLFIIPNSIENRLYFHLLRICSCHKQSLCRNRVHLRCWVQKFYLLYKRLYFQC